MDLGVGLVITSKTASYQIQELLSFSDRSKSYSCIDSQGRKLRLKLYDGNSTMRGATRDRYFQIPKMDGIMSKVDSGEIDDCPFDVFEKWKGDISNRMISLSSIKSQIILPLNEAMHIMHEMGILIRDITPRHILFYDYDHVCALSAFSNLALLSRAATATYKRSFGEDERFISPEVDQKGYSSASDYYALGVTLYAIYQGICAFNNISEEMWHKWKKTGTLPYGSSSRIQENAYYAFSQNDRLEYLIMGLTLPDPSNRWGFEEVRAWYCDQNIPLVQTGKRISYDLAIPLMIYGKQCWNYQQLAANLAQNTGSAINLTALQAIVRHISRWNISMSVRLQSAMRENDDVSGIIFRWIYILDPSLSGLWWKGIKYGSCKELAEKAEQSEDALSILSDILQNKCISFWLSNTNNAVNSATKDLVLSLESEECRKKMQGAYRFIQVFGAEPRFQYHRLTYRSISDILNYNAIGKALTESQANDILNNQSFRAWIWANGYDNVLQIIENNGTHKKLNQFDTFILLCEKIGGYSDRNMVRRLYLKRGEYAPVFWLQENIGMYSFAESRKNLKKQFLSNLVTEALSVSQMQEDLPMQIRLYLEIVRASKYTNEVIPHDPDYAFTEKWNGIEVTPLFLKGYYQ